MRVFVASWFFPPSTSSEGIVTYKLLRNSQHTYDVCSAQSDLWSYKHELPVEANNIQLFSVNTDDIDTWVKHALVIFEQEHAAQPYDAIMTRSMPPESILIGAHIKEKHPDLPWIASLADPIARNPYQIKSMIFDNKSLDEAGKAGLLNSLSYGFDSQKESDSADVRYLRSMKEMEDQAINGADALIAPCDALKSYLLGTRQRKHAYTIPHSFDKELYPATVRDMSEEHGIITFTFLGHSDELRSLKPIVLALNHLKKTHESTLKKVRFRCIGNIPSDIRDLIFTYHLHNVITIEASVDYLTSLRIMQKSSWLVHVDASFDLLSDTGGSIFFAGKIADYMGTDALILGITGAHSPAADIIERAGGVCASPIDVAQLADTITDIAEGRILKRVDRTYRDTYKSTNIAADFDIKLSELISHTEYFDRKSWPAVPAALPEQKKLVTICIPAYNVECYLDRCLLSLVSCAQANALEILVVNDGSKDGTAAIAQAYQNHYPSLIRLINKENGGHGSTINTALEQAKGKYFRIIDGDDWVDGNSFDTLLTNIATRAINVDLISSNYYQVFLEDGHTVPWTKEGDSRDYVSFDFDSSDFTMEYFTMAAAMFKTSILREPQFKIQEHTFYVDVEYLLFPIPYTRTVMFAPEYLYRYAVGNVDQSINPSTFTKRYDHHDRVMRRMLTYYQTHKETMGEGQSAYMKSLFTRHLLRSHYLLSLVWDSDSNRGLQRSADFDRFLHETDRELWEECGTRYPAVKIARARQFNPKRIKQPLCMEKSSTTFRSTVGRAIRYMKNTPLADKLATNEFLRSAVRKVLPPQNIQS